MTEKETTRLKLETAIKYNGYLSDVLKWVYDKGLYPKTIEDLQKILTNEINQASDDFNKAHKGKGGKV